MASSEGVLNTNSAPPRRIEIHPDSYHIDHVGRTHDKRQFFITNPFIPAGNNDPGREFLALYLFTRTGRLIEARIEDLGPRAEVDEPAAVRLIEQWYAELGPVHRTWIEIIPFQVERFGVEFGLILRPPEEEDSRNIWTVTAEPGDFLEFGPPWDGRYDT
jgi:hypothetical protein